MIEQIFKSLLFVVLMSPLALLGMEKELDKIELGKKLVTAAHHENRSAVARLISQGADLYQETTLGWNPLMCAVIQKNEEVARMLIAAGINVHAQNSRGETALMRAAHVFSISNSDKSRRMCSRIIRGMFREQKQRVYTFLLCLKQIPGGQYANLRNVFLPYLKDIIHEHPQAEVVRAKKEINRIKNVEVRTQLLIKYGFQPVSNSEAQ